MRESHASPRGPHADWLLEIVTGGTLEVAPAGAQPQRLPPGHGIVCRPGTLYTERVPEDDCRSVWVLFHLEPGWIDGALGVAGLCPLEDRDHLLRSSLARLREVARHRVADELAALSELYHILWLLTTANRESGGLVVRESRGGGGSVVERANRYLQRHLRDHCRVGQIAAHVGMSESGLSHLVRRETGQSPMATLRRMRVEAARAMLLRGGMSLEEIAQQTGFCDAFHLSRTFKAYTKLSPREFQQQAQDSGGADGREGKAM